MDMLLRTGEVATAGVVLTELRQGARTSAQAKAMLEPLQSLPYLEVDRDNWLAAGQIVAEARSRGQRLETVDCLLAALAMSENCSIFTLGRGLQANTGSETLSRANGLRFYSLKVKPTLFQEIRNITAFQAAALSTRGQH